MEQTGRHTAEALSPAEKRDKLAGLLSRPGTWLPTSTGQRGMVLHQLRHPASACYNLWSTHRLLAPVASTSAISPQAIAQAVEDLAQRHPALRTVCEARQGVVCQRVNDQGISLEVVDAELDPPAALAARLSTSAHRPFDAQSGPLFRAVLFTRSSDAILQMEAHHAVCDLWSLELLWDELDHPDRRPEALPFSQFALWELNWLRSPAGRAASTWWETRLQGASSFTFPGGAGEEDGGVEAISLPSDVTERLEGVARAHGCTTFTLLLSILQIVAGRLTGQDDVVVSAPVANRPDPRFERTVGYLANPLPYRVDLRSVRTWADLWRHNHTLVREGLDRQSVPGPAPAILFMFQQYQRAAWCAPRPALPTGVLSLGWRDTPGGIREVLQVEQRAALCPLTLELLRSPGGLVGGFRYRTAAFEPEQMRGVAQAWREAVDAALAHRTAGLQRAAWPVPETPPSITALFEAQARRTPDAPALTGRAGAMSFQTLDQRANALAHALRAAGVANGARVGLALRRSFASVVAMLGAMKAGATWVPLPLDDPRLAQVVASANLAAVIGEAVAGCEGPRLDVSDDTAPAGPSRAGDAALYLLFTSGSSGVPKGVLGRHRGLVNRIHWFQGVDPFRPGDVGCHKTALSFVDSVWELWGPLLSGTPVAVAEEGELLVDVLLRHRVTHVTLVPTLLELLTEETLPDMRLWISSGEPLSRARVRQFRVHQPGRLLNLYGMTEVAADVTWFDTDELTESDITVPIGRPIDKTRLRILGEDGEPVPNGDEGELFIQGAGVAEGYFGLPVETASRFLPGGWYRTGDYARRRPDGVFEYVGRKDGQVKVHGHRVELHEIEEVVRSHPAVAEAVASWSGRLAVHWVRCDGSGGPPDLAAYTAARLPEAMRPDMWYEVDSLARRTSGKMDRQAAVSADCHATLRALWEELLGVAPRDDDNFFTLGGTSLLMLRLHARLESGFRRRISLAGLMQAKTLAAQADLLATSGHATRSLVAIQADGEKPPLYLVHPAGGGILVYYELARLLGPNQPVHGFQPDWAVQHPPASLEALAAAYVEELLEHTGGGPFLLGGYSLGGKIAFEMARQMGAHDGLQGVCLLDSPGLWSRHADTQAVARLVYELKLLHWQPRSQRVGHLIDRLKKLCGVREQDDPVYCRMLELEAGWQGGPWSGRVLLVRAQDHAPGWPPDLGWSDLAQGTFQVQVVTGFHGNLLQAPAVQEVARILSAFL